MKTLKQLAAQERYTNQDREAVRQYLRRIQNDREVSNKKLEQLSGGQISSSYVSQIRDQSEAVDANGERKYSIENLAKIADQKWNVLCKTLLKVDNPNYAEITALRRIVNACDHMASAKRSKSIVGAPGRGKTFALKQYYHANPNTTYYMQIDEANKTASKFCKALCRTVHGNIEPDENPIDTVVRVLKMRSTGKQLLILDDIYYIALSAWGMLKKLHDDLTGHCGIIVAGEASMMKTINDGVRLNRRGMEAVRSRFYANRLEIPAPSHKDYEELAYFHGLPKDHPIVEVLVNNGAHVDLRRAAEILQDIYAMKGLTDLAKLKPMFDLH